MKTKPQGRKAMTLVELLTVIAIIGIMLSIAAPLMESLAKNSKHRAAVTRLLSTMDQTRAMALSTGDSHTLVVAGAGEEWPAEHRGRAFAIYRDALNAQTGEVYQLESSAWTTLPEGMIFAPVEAQKTTGDQTEQQPTDNPPMHFQGRVASAFFRFNSLGALEEPASRDQAKIRIIEGLLDDSGTPIPLRKNAYDEAVSVSPFTGRAYRELVKPSAGTEALAAHAQP